MNANLVSKVIYRSVFCAVSFITILLITGFFSVGGHDNVTVNEDTFYYYTNLSNFLCFGIMVACLCDDARRLKAGQLCGYTRSPLLRHWKFVATLVIALTFLAYGFLLGEPTALRFWNSLGNLGYHVFCPLLFILDTLLFDEHKRIGYLEPLLSIIPLGIYVVVMEIMGSRTGRYPYFFLDKSALGWSGLIMWCAILLALFLLMGYLLFLYDKLVKVNGKWRLDFSGTPAFGFMKQA